MADEVTMGHPNIGGGRPLRYCPACQRVDDYPRHVVYDDGRPDVALHVTCCRDQGCPDGSCGIITEGADTLQGAELLEHLTAQDRDEINAKKAQFAEENPDLLAQFVYTGSNPIVMEGPR